MLLVLAVPAFGSGFAVSFGYQFLIWVALALSWNLFSGNSGYASFGHGVFFGLGTYAAAAVLRSTDAPFVVALLVAGAVGARSPCSWGSRCSRRRASRATCSAW